ncbi:MAG: ComF family protein [Bacteroidetes bacterium]|nr:ComF family protein [Bacteroidota bacterium]
MKRMNLWRDLLDLFFPHLCLVCGHRRPMSEEPICLACLGRFPETNFHLHPENALTEIFWGRLPLQAGAAAYYFRKDGLIQQLIHQLKYKGRKELGVFVGERFGKQLRDVPIYHEIDYIIPVPLHPRKRRQRGYNQSTQFGLGLAKGMEISCLDDCLLRREYTQTQTRKGRWARFQNVSEAFQLHRPERIEGKHLLLVDDVLTTGATLEACGLKLLEIADVRLSLATIALAR